MRVARIELDGIGPFEKASFEIPPPPDGQVGELVLFEGPNGSGKSTILEAIATAAAEGVQANVAWILLGGPERPNARLSRWQARYRGLDGYAEVRLERAAHQAGIVLRSQFKGVLAFIGGQPTDGSSSLAKTLASLALAVRFETHPALWAAFSYRGRPDSASLAITRDREMNTWSAALADALSFGGSRSQELSLGQFLMDQTYQRLIATEAASRSQDGAERVAAQETARAREESLERLQSALGRILDRDVAFVFPLGRLDPRVSFDGEEIDADVIGEGLRATFSWLSDLLMRLSLIRWEDAQRSPFDQEFWLILDEIDESMHPLMQARLFPELRKLFPNAHIYATTHSPFAVAACTDGWVFPIRPRAGSHRVAGEQKPEALEPGQSLEYIVERVFDAPSTFVDEQTRAALAIHLDTIKALRAGAPVDLTAFRQARAFLMGLNDEVRTIVVMREGPIRKVVAEQLAEPAH